MDNICGQPMFLMELRTLLLLLLLLLVMYEATCNSAHKLIPLGQVRVSRKPLLAGELTYLVLEEVKQHRTKCKYDHKFEYLGL
jgi:hypothetical protein